MTNIHFWVDYPFNLPP